MAGRVKTASAVPAPAPGAGAERNGGLRVYWLVNKDIKEKIERGELQFATEYDAMRTLVRADTIRILEVRVGSAVAYVVALLEDDEYHYADNVEEAIRMATEDPDDVVLLTHEEIERLVKKATKRAR
jgi:hypothetical protein